MTKHTGDKELARLGVITFRIGIHGIPLDLKAEAYGSLQFGALKDYMYHRMNDRENYYYNRVFLVAYGQTIFSLHSHSMTERIWAAYGGSQGGALTLVTPPSTPE